MCGIILNIFKDKHICSERLKELIRNRGPNSSCQVEIDIGNGWRGLAVGSVLWTQGNKITAQPLFNNNGSFLLWNGDVYSGLPNCAETSDSNLLISNLMENGISIFSEISGPYAFIYYDALEKTVWFGRDALGRHSLLWNLNSFNMLIASVSPRGTEMEEVPSCGIFKVDMLKSSLDIQLYPWSHLDEDQLECSFAYSLGSRLPLSSFVSPRSYNWYNREPKEEEVQFLKGYTENTQAAIVFQQLKLHSPISTVAETFKHLLIQSVKRRIETKPNYCQDCISQLASCSHTKLAILFSGGLDSTILALISDYLIPKNESIDLYNVAFDVRWSKHSNYLVPDRKNGYESLKELSHLSPHRKWNFIEINVSQEELEELRSKHIADLIYPLSSVLDDSLGCALWFAARGKGILEGQNYTSPARVVLLGMGADELFGGYSRHRREFERYGWIGLGNQLIQELRNIGRRNLGRDNRIVTDHGRQPRLPFLDEDLLQFVNSLPPWHRCSLMPNMPPGIGDKVLLRLLAWELGIHYCSRLPKKALQFGSKIANPKEKGHELSGRLAYNSK